jgi:hypothetical protein
LYEDALSSGGFSKKLNRDSRRFRCQANHPDVMFPTDCLVDDDYNVKASSRTSSTSNDKALSTLPVANQRKELSLPSDSLDESDAESVRSHDSDMFVGMSWPMLVHLERANQSFKRK